MRVDARIRTFWLIAFCAMTSGAGAWVRVMETPPARSDTPGVMERWVRLTNESASYAVGWRNAGAWESLLLGAGDSGSPVTVWVDGEAAQDGRLFVISRQVDEDIALVQATRVIERAVITLRFLLLSGCPALLCQVTVKAIDDSGAQLTGVTLSAVGELECERLVVAEHEPWEPAKTQFTLDGVADTWLTTGCQQARSAQALLWLTEDCLQTHVDVSSRTHMFASMKRRPESSGLRFAWLGLEGVTVANAADYVRGQASSLADLLRERAADTAAAGRLTILRPPPRETPEELPTAGEFDVSIEDGGALEWRLRNAWVSVGIDAEHGGAVETSVSGRAIVKTELQVDGHPITNTQPVTVTGDERARQLLIGCQDAQAADCAVSQVVEITSDAATVGLVAQTASTPASSDVSARKLQRLVRLAPGGYVDGADYVLAGKPLSQPVYAAYGHRATELPAGLTWFAALDERLHSGVVCASTTGPVGKAICRADEGRLELQLSRAAQEAGGAVTDGIAIYPVAGMPWVDAASAEAALAVSADIRRGEIAIWLVTARRERDARLEVVVTSTIDGSSRREHQWTEGPLATAPGSAVTRRLTWQPGGRGRRAVSVAVRLGDEIAVTHLLTADSMQSGLRADES